MKFFLGYDKPEYKAHAAIGLMLPYLVDLRAASGPRSLKDVLTTTNGVSKTLF